MEHMLTSEYDGCGKCLVGVRRLSYQSDATSSPERQLDQVLSAVDSVGGHIIAWADDWEVSRATDPLTRPGLGPWLRGEKGPYSGIVGAAVDCIGRNQRDVLNTAYAIHEAGQLLVTYGHTGPWNLDNASDEMRLSMESFGAQMELRAIQERAENLRGVAEPATETEALIASLKGPGSVATRKDLQMAAASTAQAAPLPKADEADKVHEGVVVLETQDYTTVPGVAELITKGAADLAEGVKLRLKDTARNTAEVLLEMRLKMQDKHGAPDLAARSNAAKQAAQAMYNAVRGEDKLEDTFGNRDAVKKLMRAVQYQMSDVVVQYVRALDENPDEAAKFAKAAEANPELSTADAVFDFYGLNRESQGEIAAKREAEKRALIAGVQQAIGSVSKEGEGDGEGDGAAAEANPDEYAKALSHKFAKLARGVNVQLIEAASADTKEEVRGDLEAQLAIIKNLIAATL
jgi:Resolvase, N terminal domain